MKRHRDDARKTLLAPLRRREDLAQLAVAELRGRAEEVLARIERLKGQLARQNHGARQTLFQDGTVAAMGSTSRPAPRARSTSKSTASNGSTSRMAPV